MNPNETMSRDPDVKEPPVQAVPKPPADPGLTTLVMMLQFLGVPAEPEQLRHQLGVTVIGTTEMLRCTRQFNIKSRVVKTSWDRLDKTPLPAIVPLRDGGFLILGKAGDGKAIVQYPGSPRPQMLT
ncbi:type I secretion system permease/ATPase, partial [Staphylococcus coagulans]